MKKLRLILCALFGHPPVVIACCGELTCARCGAIVGDTLMNGRAMRHRSILGHDCTHCKLIRAKMTRRDRLLTPTERKKR